LLLAGEYPGHMQTRASRKRIRSFITAGIREFIDLTEDWELRPYSDLLPELARRAGSGLGYTRYPVLDLGVPAASTMVRILDAIDAHLAANRPVYLHCWGGVGRTGTVVGCWLVRHGVPGPQALAQIEAWWEHVPKRSRHPRSPETDEQRAFVIDWER
jgi:protein-tyrosine phosphatase